MCFVFVSLCVCIQYICTPVRTVKKFNTLCLCFSLMGMLLASAYLCIPLWVVASVAFDTNDEQIPFIGQAGLYLRNFIASEALDSFM